MAWRSRTQMLADIAAGSVVGYGCPPAVPYRELRTAAAVPTQDQIDADEAAAVVAAAAEAGHTITGAADYDGPTTAGRYLAVNAAADGVATVAGPDLSGVATLAGDQTFTGAKSTSLDVGVGTALIGSWGTSSGQTLNVRQYYGLGVTLGLTDGASTTTVLITAPGHDGGAPGVQVTTSAQTADQPVAKAIRDRGAGGGAGPVYAAETNTPGTVDCPAYVVRRQTAGYAGVVPVAAFDGVFATDALGSYTGRATVSARDAAAYREGVAVEADGAAAKVRLGGGAWFASVLGAAASLDFGSIAAGATAELTISVTGAAAGDPVELGAPAGIEAGLTWSGRVSAADTVTVRLHNTTGGATDPASATWRAEVTHY